MPDSPHNPDVELDPKKLKFGMPKEALDKLKRKAKERRKMNKGWKPEH